MISLVMVSMQAATRFYTYMESDHVNLLCSASHLTNGKPSEFYRMLQDDVFLLATLNKKPVGFSIVFYRDRDFH